MKPRVGRMIEVGDGGIHASDTPDHAFCAGTVREVHAALGRFIDAGDGELRVLVSYAPTGTHRVTVFGRLALAVGRVGGEDENTMSIIVRDEYRL